MGSPLPPDPYAALGLSKDADSTAIKTAYRKLVLKTHPDKFPDPAQKAEKGAEFHKIQQAYEILGDDDKRERYDAQVRLAELRKEAMERQQARGAAKADTARPSPAANYDIRTPSGTTYATRPTPRAYEESRTRAAYDDDDRYDEPPRVKSRSTKHQYVYSRGREESSSRRPSAFNIFVTTNSSAKSRDQTKRRERTEKFVPVYNDSDSEERYRQEDRRRKESLRQAAEDEDRKQREKEMFRRQAEAAARRDEELARERERERAAARGRETSRRSSSRRPEVDSYERKYMDQDAAAKEYMSKHHRGTSVPPDDAPTRTSASRSTKYAQVRPKEKSSSKRSASKEPWILSGFRHGHGSRDKSRKPTRSAEAEYDEDPRRPTLDKADSSPATLKQTLRGETQRSATVDSYDVRRERDETQTPPKMRRAETMPATKVARHEEKSKANTSKLRTDMRAEAPRHTMHDSGYSSPSTPSISDREKEKESRNAAASRMTRTAYRYGADGGVAVTTDDDVYNTVTVEPTSSSERITRKPVSRSPIGERHPERDSDDSGRERMPSARTLQQEKTARYTYPVETETRRPHLSRATTQQVPSGRSPQKDVYERGRSRTYGSPDYARGQSHDDRGYERSSRSGVLYAEIPKHAGTPLRREEIPTVRPGMRRGDSYTAQDVQYARKFTEADIRYAPRGARERSAYAFPNVEVPRPPMARGQTVM
ncbi:Chaperone protein DnaJ [Lasiodiplodia hormozganensis]|uniref:Chaperone protein DnaJ n=1 Tax=Lasiodiplodia hormozganensis TaxID=869390 RepID=A0AA39YE90_9PEZI|nr:Chaperone protein DnaJ [Lasiodiplodia hormozganensis]